MLNTDCLILFYIYIAQGKVLASIAKKKDCRQDNEKIKIMNQM